VNKIVNPDMLVLARESCGLNQTELAEAVSVTQGKISKSENGMLLVSPEDLQKITKVLNYTEEFFYQQDKVYGLGSSFLFHRQHKDVPMLLQKKIQACINILRMQVDRLLRGVEIESEHSFESLDADEYDGDAARVASIVRAMWKVPLGPVGNVTALIESAGGIVLKCSFETRLIDAAHLWLPGLPPLFFVNRDLPGDRLRWTLAHEIGHAIMHRNPTGDVEDQANCFASEFLMPKEEIQEQLRGLTLEKAATLKPYWKVSIASIIRRAWDLSGITERKYRSLNMSLSAQGYKTNEPFPIPIEEPGVIRSVVASYVNDLGYNEFDLAKLLYSADPQFFAPNSTPTILKFNNEPFFAFMEPRKDKRSII
jgi:Zn-dependent peptidase ImmA (M78 family)/transcriptional regulator with XRE-family HTH domain